MSLFALELQNEPRKDELSRQEKHRAVFLKSPQERMVKRRMSVERHVNLVPIPIGKGNNEEGGMERGEGKEFACVASKRTI